MTCYQFLVRVRLNKEVCDDGSLLFEAVNVTPHIYKLKAQIDVNATRLTPPVPASIDRPMCLVDSW
jgi:hypothetical protein